VQVHFYSKNYPLSWRIHNFMPMHTYESSERQNISGSIDASSETFLAAGIVIENCDELKPIPLPGTSRSSNRLDHHSTTGFAKDTRPRQNAVAVFHLPFLKPAIGATPIPQRRSQTKSI
jgi:hypothetical protein